MTRFLQIAFWLLLPLSLCAQDLLPFVENYSKSDYRGDNQIWNVAQGSDKAMYFANNHYFLRYDGVSWEKYNLPDKTIIRSIHVSGNRIYCGSYKEFGYWIRLNGKMKYHSLSAGKNIFGENSNEEIWKILPFNDELYFQSFNELYILKQDKIRKVKLPFQISYCFEVGGKLLFASTTQGIYTIENDKFTKLPGYDRLSGNVVHHIERFKNSTYFFTQSSGIFVEQQGSLTAWKHPLNESLKTSIINSAKFISNNRLVIGTASKGLYIVDVSSGKVQGIDRDNVLMNNSILSIAVDGEKDLWLGLDNGIAHIEVNSPVAIFSDNSGELGSVYSIAALENGSYLLASNHGVFKYGNEKMELVPNSQGQAWDIKKMGADFLIGHNSGTFVYNSNGFSRLNSVNGGWNMIRSAISDDYLQSTYCGVVIYPDSTNLAIKYEIKGFCKPVKYAVQNRKNEIWAADNYRGLYRIVYDSNYNATTIENVTAKNNIRDDFAVKIFEYRNEILFLINREWYTHNSISGKLEKNPLFSKHFYGISDIAPIDADNFLILKNGRLFLVRSHADGFVRTLVQEKYYSGKLINDNIKAFRHDGRYLLNLDDGFIALEKLNTQSTVPKIKIEAVYGDSVFEGRTKIKYNTGLRINVISGLFGSSKPPLFYKLNDQQSYSPLRNGAVILNNLESGSQKITVYYFDGANYTKAAGFAFKVAQPLYFSFWMILLYIAVISLICWFYYRWNKLRYSQKLALREEELKHQKNILELQLKAENELNVQEYEKHILELEVQSKSSEVAGKSLSIAKQGEVIDRIKHILEIETDVDKLKNEIQKAIRINAVNKHEWEIFETNLSQIHNDFILRLHKKFPALTSKDIKLCIYLKMNLSSKEIAPLMNISFRGVELHRYRLRKKLKLQSEESLYKFMAML